MIAYWDRIRSALMASDLHTHSCLTQGYCLQSWITIIKFKVIFFGNKYVCKKFDADDHYVGPARNRPAPSFRVLVVLYEGYVILVRLSDEEHPKSIWLMKILSSLNFVPTSLNFCQIEVKIYRPSTKDWKCAPHIFMLGHQKGFQVDNGLGIQTSFNKRRYHTSCLEAMQSFQIRDNDNLSKT